VGAVQLGHAKHLPAEGDNRARATLGLGAAVRRAPLRDDADPRPRLAAEDEVPVAAAGLENQAGVGLTQDIHERRRHKARFLVAHDDELNRRPRAVKLEELLDRRQGEHESALHVGHAGPVRKALLGPKRAKGGRAKRKDGVGVSEDGNPPGAAPERRAEVPLAALLAPFELAAQPLGGFRQEAEHGGDSLGVVGGRVDVHELREEVE
jgi:hypothetical protein